MQFLCKGAISNFRTLVQFLYSTISHIFDIIDVMLYILMFWLMRFCKITRNYSASLKKYLPVMGEKGKIKYYEKISKTYTRYITCHVYVILFISSR